MSSPTPQFQGHHGVVPWQRRSPYKAYQSKFGPAYRIAPNFHGVSLGHLKSYTKTAALFGGAAGTFALYFFAEVPRVSEDIMQKLPLFGDYFASLRYTAPEDNPF